MKIFHSNGTFGPRIRAYTPSFAGDVRAAACDFTGDGHDDQTSPGPGGGPHVRALQVDAADNYWAS